MVHVELDRQAYAHDLEQHLQRTLFSGGIADPEGAILHRAAGKSSNTEMAAAAEHARGLVEQNPSVLDQAAEQYTTKPARACALEDAGNAWADQGCHDNAEARLRQAHELYEQLGATDGMARVRACLRRVGTRVRHWKRADRPAAGWDSLTDTEHRIADLVAQGLSNHEVASRVFLSSHTVAFHLRHVFWKMGISSRVQLARMVAEEAAVDHKPAQPE